MTKIVYNEEQLLEYEGNGVLPAGVDLAPFNEMIAQLRETLGQVQGFGFQHRRPRRKRQPKEIVGEDGWTSLTTTTKKHNDDLEDDEFQTVVKSFRTNVAKISSGKSGVADSKDTVAVSSTSRFNAFDALNADEDE